MTPSTHRCQLLPFPSCQAVSISLIWGRNTFNPGQGAVGIENYDIVVIGGGPGGYTAGIRAAMKGASVAVVEVDTLGGVCLNRGCIPSKALIASAAQYRKMKQAEAFGLELASPPVYNWLKMRARKDKIVRTMVGGVGQLFRSHGVTHIKGYGRLTGANQVTVSDEADNETKLSAESIIIATGSRAIDIPAFPVDGKRILTSDHMFALEHLPESLLIIGAGVIGCEWAFMLAMLDVQITMVEMLDHALPLEDENSSILIERELKKAKVKLYTKTKVEAVQQGQQSVAARLSNGVSVEIDQVLTAVGRAFNTDDLGLEKPGIELNTNRSIRTGSDMRTNIDNVFAIGDVRGDILLAYTATHDGAVAVENALGGNTERNYLGVPSVIFTHPEVASVGLTESQAAENHDIAVGKFPLRALGKAHAENDIVGEVKLIGDRKTDKLLGVHIVGAHATEIIHTAALAINQGLTVTELGSLVFGHPVISESIMEAAHDLHLASVHLPRKRH